MKARQKEARLGQAMRMLICTVVCLFALSTMMVTAHAEDDQGSTTTVQTVEDTLSGSQEGAGNTNGNPEDEGNPTDNPEEETDDSKDADISAGDPAEEATDDSKDTDTSAGNKIGRAHV